ncbi:MAG TPA: hypothetical protein GX503_07215 [Clostridiales bacterium]|nr:hypothetical protein [Clostridiales bacterium]
MKKKQICFFILILFGISLFFVACSPAPQKPEPQSENSSKPLPSAMKEIEKDLLAIMLQVDQIPYFERVIAEKKESEQKKEQSEKENSTGKKPEQTTEGNKEEQKSTQKNETESEKPKPMNFRESILNDILKKEQENSDGKEDSTPPKDISETWKKINDTILQLHNRWNVLEPVLIQQNIPTETISSFEDALDNLTKSGVSEDVFQTLANANQLTAYLPKFMAPFKKQIPPEIYSLKYYIRSLVLNAATDNYPAAEESFHQIKSQSEVLKVSLIEKKATSVLNQFETSVSNLQKSLQKKDIDLIKINASIVMKNVMEMTDVFSSSFSN